jgi:hypothetical protein
VLRITVPPVCPCTEIFPKFISTTLVILMAVRIVAVAVAVVEDCACKQKGSNKENRTAIKYGLLFFILSAFRGFITGLIRNCIEL